MVSKRKVNTNMQEESNSSEDSSISWSQMMEEAAALSSGTRRSRNRYVGVRQRPSGRWVAEIKDTIQKIRMWLGTYDTAEQAARAYDEAACLLRGSNTRTNFWPSSSSSSSPPPALPSKISKLLLNRLKERNLIINNETPVNNNNNNNNNNSNNKSSDENTTLLINETSDDVVLDICEASVVDNDVKREEEEEVEGEIDEIEMMGRVDFGFVDELLLGVDKECYCSPFEIAEEIMRPLEKEDDDDDVIWKYERTFSASLYAFNGVSECLKKLKSSSGLEDNKKDDEEKKDEQQQQQQQGMMMMNLMGCCWSPSSTGLDDAFGFNLM